MIGLKIIKIRPLVPDLDLQMSKKQYFDILKAKLGPNGPISMLSDRLYTVLHLSDLLCLSINSFRPQSVVVGMVYSQVSIFCTAFIL